MSDSFLTFLAPLLFSFNCFPEMLEQNLFWIILFLFSTSSWFLGNGQLYFALRQWPCSYSIYFCLKQGLVLISWAFEAASGNKRKLSSESFSNNCFSDLSAWSLTFSWWSCLIKALRFLELWFPNLFFMNCSLILIFFCFVPAFWK